MAYGCTAAGPDRVGDGSSLPGLSTEEALGPVARDWYNAVGPVLQVGMRLSLVYIGA